MNFIHTFGKLGGQEAQVRIWSNELGCQITKEGRDYAAMALRKLRANGVHLEKKVVTK
tara:strand:- start:16 stop:189 length:174 start_codon:yes stop_codon:yes gene_type:complete